MSIHIIDKYIKIEEELDLYSKQVKGFHYWQFIREEIYNNIIAKKNNAGIGFQKTIIPFKEIPKLLINSLINHKYSIKRHSGKYDILFSCHPRRIFDRGLYTSIYTDIYAEHYKSSITLEVPHEGEHYVPCLTSNILYLDRMFYYRAILLHLKKARLPEVDIESIKKTVSDVCNYIKIYLNYDLNCDSIVNRIIYFYSRYMVTLKYYRKLLRNIKPKIIVEVVYYTFENMVLNEVAKDENIPVIELQHGLTGNYHIAYNYGCMNYYNNLPNLFLSFSDYWTQNMRIPAYTTVKSAGFAYFDKTLSEHPAKTNPNVILFLSSGTVGNELSKIAIALNGLLKGHSLKIVYKLHPGEFKDWKNRYSEFIDSGIEVIDNTNVNLYDLFANSVAQIGVYSTALFEGLAYNLKTYVMDHGQIDHVKCLLDLGYARLITNAEEIYSDLFKDEKDFKYNSSLFWKPRAFNNVCTEIDNMLSIINKENLK